MIGEFFVGFVLVSADYSQLELRVLAGLSKDEGLCKLFCAGADFFQTVTDRWNADTSIDVPLDRQKVKQLCYAIIYGMGAVTLGERIGATKQKAQHLIESFFKEFPNLDARIVMQVHDEVIVELNEACFSIAVERIESAMLNAFPEFP
uniref:DNA-directed DNA polymerase n=1 Tax=Parascaris equorum TaxID=6256 RepID=A0A914RJB1_PAREQ